MSGHENFLAVSEAESGQKLLRYLERRLGLPSNLLHRWVRTGQIRVNGKRCGPFDLVQSGNEIRLPPFALKLCASQPGAEADGELPPLLGEANGILAFNKPSGLLCQPGPDGEQDLASMLAAKYSHLPFKPAPGHRLDRETSGVLLVGATFQALQRLHLAFKNGDIHKEYLAWIRGEWPYGSQVLLKHYLGEENGGIKAYADSRPDRREALCLVAPLRVEPGKSLLQIQLLTGRKRQIRAQLAACGHPVLGDRRYADPESEGLKLHSLRAILPDGVQFSCLPPWRGEYTVGELPEALPNQPQNESS